MTAQVDIAALADRLERISIGYAAREGIDRNDDWFLLKLVEELGELTQMQLARTGRSKDRGLDAEQLDARLAEECADVLGHVLLFARRNGIDLDAALDAKWFRWERLA
ncbi:pyrophosphatase [uncultured Amnibacterium sp.]|uniref:pyrophosphatase n=1 Tax=uncultured Amnibacterium sp. TaxID=1631851 RepID=UPI0035CA648A